jgi:predicted Zn-dependent protease
VTRRVTAITLAAALLAAGGAMGAEPAKPSRYVMPPPGYTPDMKSDEAGLWMQVDKAEDAIKTAPSLVRDEKLNAYVSQLVCRLAGEYCPSIRVYVVQVPSFNASMAPNGMMLVHTGLLMRTENEAQLAFVLGHEITHYLHRHSLQRWRQLINTRGFLSFFTLAAVGAGAPGLIDVASTIGVAGIYSNSREHERDADATGFTRVTEAGYAPGEAPAIWRHVASEDKANPRNIDRPAMWLSTHPAPEERIANMEKQAGEAQARRSDWVRNEDPFRAATDAFLNRWVEDDLALGRNDESAELFRRLSATMPSRGIYRYGLGEAYRKRNKGTDAAAAMAAYRGALECADAPASAWRGLGLVAMKAGDKAAAREAFSKYRLAAPEAGDKAMIDFYLSQL